VLKKSAIFKAERAYKSISMKKLLPFILILVWLILNVTHSSSQDLFVSQFDFAPMMTNPAQTGDYFGTLRLGGTYRDQGFAVTKNRFNTPSFYIDAPVFDGFGEKDWIGVGGYIIQDRAGAGQLVTGEFQFSGAYHLSLSQNAFRYFTLGIQMGTYQRRFRRANNLRFGDGLGAGQQSTDLARASTESRPRWSFAIGGMFRTKDANENEIRIGGKVGRLFRHDYSILQRGGGQGMQPGGGSPGGPGGGGGISGPGGIGPGGAFTNIPLRYVGHASYDIGLNNGMVITPQAIFQLMDNFTETTIQVRSKIPVNEEKKISLLPGVGYRFGDAAQLLLGLEIKDLRVSLAYDMTTSALAQANSRTGALELAVMWIVKIEKEPEVQRRIFCPRY